MGGNAQGKLSEALLCPICERGCRLAEGKTGACGLYRRQGDGVVEIMADRYLVACPISIETMPMLHYFPGQKFFQVSTTGCNFDCPGCVSTVIVREMPRDSKALQNLTPDEVIDQALAAGCMGLALLMNDPLASLPTFLRLARAAKARGLKVGCASNAYFTPQALESLLPVLDFINIGIKGYSDQSYRACGGSAGMAPVFRNLEALVAAGVHVELSVMFGRDKEPELVELARRVAAISPAIPLQLMRFIPFEGADMTQEPGVLQAEAFCRRLRGVLRHVYLFNTPGTQYLNTVCPGCGQVAIRREFYGPMGAKLLSGASVGAAEVRCQVCGGGLDIVGQAGEGTHKEGDFQGGYPFTRALEMVEAMLIAMGVRQQKDVVTAWEHLLRPGGLRTLHLGVQNPRSYIDLTREFGRLIGSEERAEDLAGYLEAKLDGLAEALRGVGRRPKVYYAMGKPLFYINGGRMENQLVEFAGGESLNKQLPPGGRPGRGLGVERLNELNPEVIFISAFLSNTVEDFLAECLELGVEADAVKQKRVYVHPAPGWDFGSPRWVLGLLYMAQVLHPQRCACDVMAEAQEFYQRFYGMDFSPLDVNRSFAKPADNWRWQAGGAKASPESTESNLR